MTEFDSCIRTLPQNNLSPISGFTIQQASSLNTIGATDWNRLASTNNPFLSYEFLQGLEECDCLEAQGWLPQHLVVYEQSRLVGALPLYLKTNSYGEFVFDWSWADAYERAGGQYYPKLVSAIPFTPVQGPRLLIDKSHDRPEVIKAVLLQTIVEITETRGISSFHCLLQDPPDEPGYSAYQFLPRKSIQFHWHNHAYRDFDDFLERLSSKKRKQIKRERRQVREAGLEIEVLSGDMITPRLWRIFYEFYCSTFHKRWGNPRLSCEFFQLLSERLPHQTLLLLASKNRNYVAGAFAMLNGDTLYGRHWGCNSQYSNLHFELCYYQTIDYCIRNGLTTLDAGVQGEHKLSRGFEPVITWSHHWIRHQGFRKAIHDFLDRESVEIDEYVRQLISHLPYKDATVV
ncbi:MAG: uncharacterized protein HW386_916 [Gammaproteobacteria bacterium]|nr:uncharacterized protein [Gammaproteobacteria bacterium]